MIRFLLKGLLRERSRSLFPTLIVAIGVMLTVFLHAYLNGAVTMIVQSTANYSTGHVRVTTKAYAEQADQMPNDLALLGIDTLMAELRQSYPELHWTPRIKFGGLLDIPDEHGETRAQTPVFGLGVALLSQESHEWKILNIHHAVVKGRVLENPGEILIADELAQRLGVRPGETATLISSTMYGSMALSNFTIAGTVRFGIAAMDRGAMIADIADVQQALDMQRAAGEIAGFFPDNLYHEKRANLMAAQFNSLHTEGPFSPTMRTLRSEGGIADYLDLVGTFSGIFIAIFVFAMSIVLWNAGLTGNLRRYGEFGLRLAIGEEKGHLYRSVLAEALMIGVGGSLLGTAIGLACAYYVQVHGIDVSSMMERSTMMISNVLRAQVTPVSYCIGFLPGILATFLGAALSGIGIYKRQTAQLFKELET
ncbi:MAG: FtsX-like permease family protein [candidate division KSB1 bacterium]|nr:FtsX-like permease family protein [candidate division KSB1 bacterium]MDZ7304194.1 FtsX-like permease family protein [candidate division KSB1 bacterium]MDZ7313436.1 FtsX-like permease family protein [candidate division KSB1 bacterium]